jgi:hypothetical protein
MNQFRRPHLQQFHGYIRLFLVVLGLNALFALIALSASFLPSNLIIRRVKEAFSRGELVERDYLKYDSRRGFHQYNDCNILQMMANPDSSRVGRALGPWLHMADGSATETCRTLRELIVEGRDAQTYVSSRYTRYWHGYIPVLSVLLMFLDISSVREILRIMVYMAAALPLLSSFREKRFLFLTGPVSITGICFWSLPYYGQGLSHALGDCVVMLGIASLVFWNRKFSHEGSLVLFCAIFGSIVVYFEMLTGQLPVAAGLLFPIAYFLSRLTNSPDTPIKFHIRTAAMALLAFVMGAMVTVGARILVAAVSVQPSGLDTFAGNLALYTQPLESTTYVPGFLRPFGRLLRRGDVLTYGSDWGMVVLYGSAALSWAAGIYLAFRRKSMLGWADQLALMIGAASIPAWTVILQSHTFMHADFMARTLIVPISLGWSSVLWQAGLKRDPRLLSENTDKKRTDAVNYMSYIRVDPVEV